MAAGPSLNGIIEALRRQTDLEVLQGLLKYPVDLDRDVAGALKISRDVIGKLAGQKKWQPEKESGTQGRHGLCQAASFDELPAL